MRRQWMFMACLAASPLLAGDDGAKFGAAPLHQAQTELSPSKTSILKGRKLEQVLTRYAGIDSKVEVTEDNASRTLSAIIKTYDAVGNETGEGVRTFKATGYEVYKPMDAKVPSVIVNFRDHLKNVFWVEFRFKSDAGMQAFVANLNQIQSYHLRLEYAKTYHKAGSNPDGSRIYGAFVAEGEDSLDWQGPL